MPTSTRSTRSGTSCRARVRAFVDFLALSLAPRAETRPHFSAARQRQRRLVAHLLQRKARADLLDPRDRRELLQDESLQRARCRPRPRGSGSRVAGHQVALHHLVVRGDAALEARPARRVLCSLQADGDEHVQAQAERLAGRPAPRSGGSCRRPPARFTRARQGEGDRCTRRASSTLDSEPSRCSSAQDREVDGVELHEMLSE